jgi:hypothetical protein
MTKCTKGFRFQPNTYDSKTKDSQLPTLINDPTLKTIISFLGSTLFIIGNSVTNVR